MIIFDNRYYKYDEEEKTMTVEEFFAEVNDNNYLNFGDGQIKVFDNNYFDEDLEAPIFRPLELDERQWKSEVLIAHIFKNLIVLMIA